MQIKKCTLMDTKKLACLNKQLIEDEQSDNPMTLEELEYRMERFITTEYDANFLSSGNIVKSTWELRRFSCLKSI